MSTLSGVRLHWKTLAALMVFGLGLASQAWAAQDTNGTSTPCGPCSGTDPREDAALQACQADEICAPPRPFLYFRADAVMLHRNNLTPTNVASLGTTPNITVLSTNSLDSPFKAGPKFTIGHTFADPTYQIEFTYLWLDSWDEANSVRNATTNSLGTAGNLFSVFTGFGATVVPAPGFDRNNYVVIRESSYMETGELNVRHTLPTQTDNFAASYVVGIRHMGIREGFDYLSESAITTTPPTLGSLDVQTRTLNDLWGPQIGGLFEFYCQHNLWFNCDVKGALCNNSMIQETTGNLNTGAPVPFNYRRTTNGTAGVVDVDLSVVYRPSPHVTTRFGYQALWITGVAMASRNFDPDYNTLQSGPAWLDTQGTVLYHGPHAGLELSW